MFYKHLKIFLLLPFFFILLIGCQKAGNEPVFTKKKTVLDKGDTLDKSLGSLFLSPEIKYEIIANLRKVFNPRHSKPGDYYEIEVNTNTAVSWIAFSYYPQSKEYYRLIKSTSNDIEAKKLEREILNETIRAKGSVKSSLWESMIEQNIDPGVILDYADIFAWQIDFLTEPREGDTYKVIYEKKYLDNGKILNNQIIGAQYNLHGKDYTAIFFTDENGRKGYYSPDGKSLISAFLRAPLQYRRISSYFTKARFHPILKYFRPHLGIDYAAPEGTPVSSIGDGVVIHSGWKGQNGNLVGIKHSNGYCSYYGHLSRYGKGIKKGRRVSQGQVIGYVGTTGLSTGPHLDFRVKKNGSFINFLKMKIPPSKTIGKNDMENFKEIKKYIFRQFAELNYL